MNVASMHLAIQQGVDKINSLQADLLLPEEIDIELNKSQDRFINLKYGRNNKFQKGFEESQKRIDDLRTLVTEFEAPTLFKEDLGRNFFIDFFTLPEDYLYLVNVLSRVHINDTCTPVKYNLKNQAPFVYFKLGLDVLFFNDLIADQIVMMEDLNDLTAGQSVLWENLSGFQYPQDINNVINDVLDNHYFGFDVYWEQFDDIYEKNHFIVIPEPDVYPWLQHDASVGTVTHLVNLSNTTNILGDGEPAKFSSESASKRVLLEDPEEVTVSSKFVQQDDIFTLLLDPFNTTKHTSPIYTIRANNLDIYTSDIFIIDAVKITYLRKPSKISLSLGISCELPEHCHQEIVDMTVSSILEGISDPRYQTHQIEVNKNE